VLLFEFVELSLLRCRCGSCDPTQLHRRHLQRHEIFAMGNALKCKRDSNSTHTTADDDDKYEKNCV